MITALLEVQAPNANPSCASDLPRVFVIGCQNVADSFEWHILDSLRHLQFDCEFFGTNQTTASMPKVLDKGWSKARTLLLREPERRSESRLIRALAAFQPSLVLVVLGNQLSPKTVRRLRSATKAPIVCWCQDQMTTLGRQFLLASEYDAVFVKDLYMQDLFSRMIKSTAFYYLPEACNPRVHRSVELTPLDRQRYGCDVMIAGTLYYYRQEILRQLASVDLKVWGARPDWLMTRLKLSNDRGEIFNDEKARAMAAARICLNTLHFAEVNGLNCRAFEIAGCGGFQLVTSVPVLATHFEVDKEVVAFNSSAQLVELVRHYLDQPEAASAIARQGQLRAHRDHTYEHRLNEIFRIALGHAAINA